MPRDGSGNFTLAPGNPVVPGTVIEAAWANPTLSDIASNITDSLSRTGQGGMLVPFRNTDGTVGAPGMTWNNEPSSGWYRAGLNDFWYSVGNENIFRITKTSIELAAGKTFVGLTLGNINVASGILIASDPGIEVTQTWNNGAVTFIGADTNITDTASAAASLIERWRVNSVEVASIRKDGAVLAVSVLVPTGSGLFANTADAADNALISVGGGGAGSFTRGGTIFFAGNEHATLPGVVSIAAGGATGTIKFNTNNVEVGSFSATGNLTLATGALILPVNGEIRVPTADAADTGDIHLCGGGASSSTRGSFVRVNGNENATFPGNIVLNAGNVSGGNIKFFGGSGVSNAEQVRITPLSGAETFWNFAGGRGSTTTLAACTLSTADGADNSGLLFNGGGGGTQTRGAALQLHGNEFGSDAGYFIMRGGENGSGQINMYTASTLRFSLTYGGNAAWTGANFGASVTGINYFYTSGAATPCLDIRNTAVNPLGQTTSYIGAAPNDTGHIYFNCNDAAVPRLYIPSNGGIYNYSANNVNISDATVKSDITPVTPDHIAQLWAAHKAIDWGHFKFSDQTHDDPNFGYTAQGVAAAFATAAPWLVGEFMHTEGVTKLGIYNEDLHNITGAIVSELQRRVEALEAAP